MDFDFQNCEVELIEKELNRTKKNKVAFLDYLVKTCRYVENIWDSSPERRQNILGIIVETLGTLRTHKDRDVQELSRLAPKMRKLNFDLKHFLIMFLPIERRYSKSLRDDQIVIDTKDRGKYRKIPLIVICDNLRSAFNVGSVFRTSECVGVSKIFVCGYTSSPTDQQTQKTTMGTHKNVEWQESETAGEVIEWLKNKQIPTIALETVAGCVSLFEFSFPLPSLAVFDREEVDNINDDNNNKNNNKGGDVNMAGGKKEKEEEEEGKEKEITLPFWLNGEGGDNPNSPRALAILIGNERHGISEELVSRCHTAVRIPCIGKKNSLNVGVAFSVCAFEVLRQWGMAEE